MSNKFELSGYLGITLGIGMFSIGLGLNHDGMATTGMMTAFLSLPVIGLAREWGVWFKRPR